MTVITATNSSHSGFVGSSGSFGERESNSGVSLIKIAKTVGVLALLLSGGARAENRSAFQANRRLMNAGYEPEPDPYNYASVCDNGISGPYVAGTNREDCTAQEKIELDKLKVKKSGRLNRLERCYKVSGYLSAALFGSTFLACVGVKEGSGSGVAGAIAALGTGGGVSLLSTAICGFMHVHVEDRISDAEDKAKECCDIFPTQEEVAAFQNNSTSVAAPPPANVSMPINSTADAARR